jgi:hypothetical protein
MSKQDRAATTPFLDEQQDRVGEPLLCEQPGLAVGDPHFMGGEPVLAALSSAADTMD